MQYDLNWGKDQKFFDALKAKGKRIGARANRRPLVPKALSQYWKAFLDLHKRRQWQQACPQPLTYTELKAYIELKFYSRKPEQVRRLLKFVEELDNAYLTDFSEKQEGS